MAGTTLSIKLNESHAHGLFYFLVFESRVYGSEEDIIDLISDLPNLKSLDNKGLQQLTSLRELWIQYCPELQFSTGSVLQCLISLKKLGIDSCGRLQSLTEAGLHHLTTLETLHIDDCPKLQYLTKERLPDSLLYLHINECPPLEQRLQFEKGQEWRYISHIPKITIGLELF
ncbi:hypothetical protein CK203_028892 [Vitis vinifera]|uniref:Uncharacterized protein n=1 Tax=Vitis vinifera TaxID=29760 RepID=A0A438IAE5_VITVI|nr:hypothetical protein CK203_028892 [Vitis vinifera]